MYVSLLLGRKAKGNLLVVYTPFLQVFERGFYLREEMVDECRVNYRALMDIFGIKLDSFQFYCFDIQVAAFFQTPGLFIDSSGRLMQSRE